MVRDALQFSSFPVYFPTVSELSNRNPLLGARKPETCIMKENERMRAQRGEGVDSISSATVVMLDSESINYVPIPSSHTSSSIHLPTLNPTKSLNHMKSEFHLEKYDTGAIYLP